MKTKILKPIFSAFVFLILSVFFLAMDASGQWVQTNYNLYGKTIYTMTSSGDTIFAGTNGTGIYYSTNNGVNWTQTSLNNLFVYSIYLYNASIYTASGGNVYYSSNRGQNWVPSTGLGPAYAVTYMNNTLYAGVQDAGVYLSTNNGTNWIQTSMGSRTVMGLGSANGYVIAGTQNYGIYYSSNNGISWAQSSATGGESKTIIYTDGKFYASCRYSNRGVLVSTNNGVNWSNIGPGYDLSSLCVSGSNIFAGWGNGVQVTTNGGALWSATNVTRNTLSMCKTSTMVFAGTDNGFYSTSDLGQTWSAPPPSNISAILNINNVLYAGTTEGVFKSTNGGLTWDYKNLMNSTLSLLSDSNYIFAGTNGNGVYYTTNNGLNWTQTSMTTYSVNSLARKNNYIFAATSGNGVYYTTNRGVNWVQSSLSGITAYAVFATDSVLYAGTSFGGAYISTNNGANWTQSSLSFMDVNSFNSNGNRVYAGTPNGVYYTTNNGTNWTQTSLTTNTIISFTNYGTTIFAGTTGAGVYMTKNSGVNWIQVNDGMGNQRVGALSTYGNYIVAGTTSSIWRRYILEFAPIRGDATLDSLVNVLDVTATVNYILGNNPSPFSFLAADVNTDNNINVLDVVGIVNIILHPTNKFFAQNEQTDKSGTAFLTLQNNQLNLTNTVKVSAMQFKLSGTGLNGVTFTPSPQLLNYQVAVSTNSDTSKTYVIFNMSDTSIGTGVHNLGTFTGLNSGVTMNNVVIADEEGNGIITGTPGNQGAEIPKDYYLGQNFPNPFNPFTMIKFAIPKSGITTLKIFDVTGRLVKTLVDGYVEAGYYEREFNATSLSSGIYFYTLNSGSYSAVKKMAVIK